MAEGRSGRGKGAGGSPGRKGKASAPARPEAAAATDAANAIDPHRTLRRSVISDAFQVTNEARRERLGLPPNKTTPASMMIELNLHHRDGLRGAEQQLLDVWQAGAFTETTRPEKVASTYFRWRATLNDAQRLVDADADKAEETARADAAAAATRATAPAATPNVPPGMARGRAIYRIWPDFRIRRLIDRSVATVKADAARRSYAAAGAKITWAVIDSGIDRNHPHFKTYDTLDVDGRGDAARLHRDFTLPDTLPGESADDRVTRLVTGALTDAEGHGTHVAGIIAGAARAADGDVPAGAAAASTIEVRVAEHADSGLDGLSPRHVEDARALAGVAPRAKLVSLKVLGGGADTTSNVLRALRYVREEINGEGKIQRVQGVNLSLGYEFDAKWFACGQSPICVEVDRLVRSGVVVVVAAGNTGYGDLTSREGITSTGLSLTINDPGNAEMAITVGATHRDSPHTYGVSYFSSKGPTGDGRLKPDLVAPGERITSCAAGKALTMMQAMLADIVAPAVPAPYIDDSGTSMAAPHVSGAVAAFLSIRREYIGRPEEVKRIFLDSATSLGRERYFEGRGMIDLMRAIQSV